MRDHSTAIYAHLQALTGDIEAFVTDSTMLRWRSTGYEHFLIAAGRERSVFFGFGVTPDDMVLEFSTQLGASTVRTPVGLRMSPFYAHAWMADYLDALGLDEDAAADTYANAFLEDICERIRTGQLCHEPLLAGEKGL